MEKDIINSRLENIMTRLIINGTLVDNPGLFYGKMGIAIFFFHYSRYTGNELFQDYAMELIEEIQKKITVNSLPRYDTGLVGIGVGIEYLLKNKFIEADADDILSDFDDRMYRAAMYEPYPDLSLHAGLCGWGRYFIWRLTNPPGSDVKRKHLHKALMHILREMDEKIHENLPIAEQTDVYCFLQDTVRLLPICAQHAGKIKKRCMAWESIQHPDPSVLFPYLGNTHTENIVRLYHCCQYFGMNLEKEINLFYQGSSNEDVHPITGNMGILKGYSGEGLCQLTTLCRHDDLWIQLL